MTRGRFLSDETRIYPSVPITVEAGDIVDWPDGLPDGLWEDAGNAPVTRHPDNADQDQPVSEAPTPASVPPADVPPPDETPAVAPAAE